MLDTDGDGIPNSVDLDDDNDGILDTVEEATSTNGKDTDGDGIPDSLDLDSDNDGILDIEESSNGGIDLNGDGRVDGPFGANGFADELETSIDSGTAIEGPVDTDGDGIPDFQDVDSDNDGISDLIEGGSDSILDKDNDGMIDSSNPDIDQNGVIDIVDPNQSGTIAETPDTDGDNVEDYRDLDSDNDGLNDLIEGGLPDEDNDGLVDSLGDLADATNLPDQDGNGVADYLEPNNPNLSTLVDSDEDGVVDGEDSDGDGILDHVDGLEGFGDALSDVLGVSSLVIVNSFSPNNDGKNEDFRIENILFVAPNFEMEIRNRYGNIVYQYKHDGDTSKEPKWWDGYSSGRMTLNSSELVPAGTYFYVIKFNDLKKNIATGWVYLNR
ncbi:MAG: hypothetical protein COB98_01890 [Flavobacteriaceae bacterium]|nr:MAG: hypothetical protein COB98_01890 [Flavobacteriaceae bacterium]